jgi:hypothetical protein
MNCGVIENGRAADIIGFRLKGEYDDWYSVPFESKRDNADFVMIDGEKLF